MYLGSGRKLGVETCSCDSQSGATSVRLSLSAGMIPNLEANLQQKVLRAGRNHRFLNVEGRMEVGKGGDTGEIVRDCILISL